tara:strand:- start:88 stop:714 length:627 start_codon:yes stop_codon:yes gene_type:complete
MGQLTQTTSEVQSDLDRVWPKASGSGIKVDLTTPTFPWHDILGTIDIQTTGPNNPSYLQVGATSFYDFQFDIGEKCQINFHLPHDYAEGTDVHFHAHWIADGTDTNTVKWQFEYAYADGHGGGVFPLGSSTTVTAEEAAAGVAYTHMVTETTAQTISGCEPDGIIQCIITRITNGGTNNTDNIFLKEADVHYQSTGIGTKNKSPDFYS